MPKFLFKSYLGDRFNDLPEAVQRLHMVQGNQKWRGSSDVMRGAGVFSYVIASIFGFPPAGKAVEIRVDIDATPNRERWIRRFGKRSFHSRLRLDDQNRLYEKFGATEVEMTLELRDGRLYFIPIGWRLCGLPMPQFLLPKGNSFEFEKNGKFHFDVKMELPIFGLIVGYKGWLEPSV